MRLLKLHALLFACLLAGCGSETSGPSTVTDSGSAGADTIEAAEETGEDTGVAPSDTAVTTGASFDDVYTKVLSGSCAGGYCHGSSAGGWKFTGDKAGTYAQLVNTNSSSCSGLKKVEPGQPEKSSLYLKMRGSFSGVCTGNKMPSGGGTATAAELELVRSWIAAGAAP